MNNFEIISDLFLNAGNLNNFDFEKALYTVIIVSMLCLLMNISSVESTIKLVLGSIIIGFMPYIFVSWVCIIVYPIMLLTGEAEFTMLTTVIDIILLIFIIALPIIMTLYAVKYPDKSDKRCCLNCTQKNCLNCLNKDKYELNDVKSTANNKSCSSQAKL